MIKSYKDLEVWQKARALTKNIYEATENFPKREWYGLANQLRRAAVSVASNLAEGSVRGSKEFAQFIVISRGSLAELETQILVALDQKFLTKEQYIRLEREAEIISRMLMGLSRSIQAAAINQAQGTRHKAQPSPRKAAS